MKDLCCGVKGGPRVEYGLGEGTSQLRVSERDMGSSVDSERTRGFLLGLAMGQSVCQVCCLLETLLMRWDTCQDLDEAQNLTTTMDYNYSCENNTKDQTAVFRPIMRSYICISNYR